MLHNESVNIWSHLLGTIFIVFLIGYTTVYMTSHKEIFKGDFSKVKSELLSYAKPIKNAIPNLYDVTYESLI